MKGQLSEQFQFLCLLFYTGCRGFDKVGYREIQIDCIDRKRERKIRKDNYSSKSNFSAYSSILDAEDLTK